MALGRVVLPVQAKEVVKMIEFFVVKVPSLYNAIMERTWLHEMKAIASTYHQVIKFPTIFDVENPEQPKIEEVFGDQISAKMCFMTAMKGKGKAEQVQIIEVPDQPVLEDVGEEAKHKVVEDLETVQIDESNSEKFFLLGTSLTQTERAQMLEFLHENLEVFAWTPYEMPGLDPNFICHKLNVDPGARPVVQRGRRAASQHAEAVVKEVEKLLEAGSIKEILYPKWLSNTVVVKKNPGRYSIRPLYKN